MIKNHNNTLKNLLFSFLFLSSSVNAEVPNFNDMRRHGILGTAAYFLHTKESFSFNNREFTYNAPKKFCHRHLQNNTTREFQITKLLVPCDEKESTTPSCSLAISVMFPEEKHNFVVSKQTFAQQLYKNFNESLPDSAQFVGYSLQNGGDQTLQSYFDTHTNNFNSIIHFLVNRTHLAVRALTPLKRINKQSNEHMFLQGMQNSQKCLILAEQLANTITAR